MRACFYCKEINKNVICPDCLRMLKQGYITKKGILSNVSKI